MHTNGTDAGVRVGDVLAGKYRVERVLGVGGMGIVVAAHHLQLDEMVALKFLLPQALHSAESVSRFLREARAAVKIKNEHVARVSDVGQLENGSPYIVMEYLEGSDLANMLRAHGPMPFDQAVDFVLQACEALADAHALGIVHRDLKPANLFCITRSDGQPSIKVLVFGISKITTPGAPGHDMTRTSALMGSPLYMSPEQMQMSKAVDLRTDIWALGVILFELVTGRPPFTAEVVTELAIKVANEAAPPVRSIRLDAPEGLARAIARCLEKDRAARFQTVGELAVALADFGSRRSRQSVEGILGTLRKAGMFEAVQPASFQPPLAAPGSQAAATAPQTDASWGNATAAPGSSGGRAAVAVAVAAIVGVAAAGGFLMLRKPAGPQPAAPAATFATSLPPAVESVAVMLPDAATALAATPAVSAPALSPAPLPAAPTTKPPTSPVRPASNAPPIATPSSAPPGVAPAVSPAAVPPSPSARKPNCNPPYVIDSAGDRQYKPECL